jgi:hypothetical protein
MKNSNYCKKLFRYFSIFEYEKEEQFLREMHKDGWKFIKVTGFGVYHFEKCISEDVVYQLDYNRDAKKNREEYLQMFSDCGWEHLQEFAGYSYFRKPAAEMNGEESIFCDEESKIAMMERVMKGRFTPLVIIFFCYLFPQFIINLTSAQNYYIAAMYGGLMAVYLTVFLIGARGYLKLKNKRR